ncbi:immunity protein Imm33 domain-containing protein [Mucilaginibacter flavidus]|uniref:immunity protein Imm33 domain-containing protein n=1 Tax=Mucilaginibacter flavidus TaxID=2949309 RepID=UPI00209355C3|nr:hypothetical protein [Mucilaginibacter flavidus]MCO5946153.1 hypothetical protein [Mucilaginibacter flavidus]
MDYINEQKLVCERYGSPFYESQMFLKVGISKNVKNGVWPINGLRHPLEGDTTGWYIWAGEEFSTEPDFFTPLHVEHLEDWCPLALKYLGLAPGWRFLLAPDYEDVWEDLQLLQI